MKKYIFALLVTMTLGASAQSTYEVSRLFGTELSGTARFVGMGGSMSALGADLSVLGVNPAGAAIYRSSDISLTASLTTQNITADYQGTKAKADKTPFSLDNVGAVFAYKAASGSLEYLNVGFNYKRKHNLTREFSMAGASGGYSQMYQMQQLYYNKPFDITEMSYKNYTSLSYPWLALLAADGGLLYEGYVNEKGEICEQGELLYPDPTSAVYYSEERGGVDVVDLNVALNLNNRFYIGLTVGAHYVDYSRMSYYGEDDSYGPIYTLNNWYDTRGEGIDFKLGVIVRPFYYSSFRIAASVHTPTWYSLTDRMSAVIQGQPTDFTTGTMDTRSYDYAYGDDYYIDYQLATPWVFNVGAAYTFGTTLALNAEYEYCDYSTASMEYKGGYRMSAMDDEFKSNLKAVHSFRVGAEFMIDRNFSLRCGYNHTSAPYKEDAAKYMLSYVDTNTEYMNSYETNNYTAGFGYRGKSFYFDAAYMRTVQDADFYPFYDAEYINPAASVEDTRDKFVVTLGMRF